MVLHKYLEKNKLTQRAFANQIGCTVAFFNGLMNGKNTDVKISLVRKIHDATGIDESKLISDLLKFKTTTKS